jgi:ABC-type glycerol-3-phosphate transport system substrate-binding protein
MATKLNKEALQFAKELIKKGNIEKSEGSWSQSQPSTEEENKFIAKQDMQTYGNWHLGIDSNEDNENKGRYKFPYGDYKKVYRSGLIAVKQRAAQNNYADIEKAADELLGLIDQANK